MAADNQFADGKINIEAFFTPPSLFISLWRIGRWKTAAFLLAEQWKWRLPFTAALESTLPKWKGWSGFRNSFRFTKRKTLLGKGIVKRKNFNWIFYWNLPCLRLTCPNRSRKLQEQRIGYHPEDLWKFVYGMVTIWAAGSSLIPTRHPAGPDST